MFKLASLSSVSLIALTVAACAGGTGPGSTGSGSTISNISCVAPTGSQIGCVKAGTNVSIATDGTISATSGSPGGTSGQVQVNSGSSTFSGITNVSLTALIQAFSSSLSGAVPASGGGTTTFLRADGSWAAPPSSAPGGSLGQVQTYGTGGVLAGISNTTLTSLIQNFGTSTSGAVASTGTVGLTTNFLRADNTWAVPTVIANGTLGEVQTYGTGGVITGITNTALTALINNFGTTTSGAVPAPGTAVTSGFLQYNGTWANPSGTGITALTGDGTASGSGSVSLTLSTVNSSPGSYGDATHVGTFTVNGKGLVTNSGTTAIQTASASQVGLAEFPLAGSLLVNSGNVAVNNQLVANMLQSAALLLPSTPTGLPGEYWYNGIVCQQPGTFVGANASSPIQVWLNAIFGVLPTTGPVGTFISNGGCPTQVPGTYVPSNVNVQDVNIAATYFPSTPARPVTVWINGGLSVANVVATGGGGSGSIATALPGTTPGNFYGTTNLAGQATVVIPNAVTGGVTGPELYDPSLLAIAGSNVGNGTGGAGPGNGVLGGANSGVNLLTTNATTASPPASGLCAITTGTYGVITFGACSSSGSSTFSGTLTSSGLFSYNLTDTTPDLLTNNYTLSSSDSEFQQFYLTSAAATLTLYTPTGHPNYIINNAPDSSFAVTVYSSNGGPSGSPYYVAILAPGQTCNLRYNAALPHDWNCI